MPQQFRPLLAYNATNGPHRFPLLVSPKIDGIRCLLGPQGAVSRTLKPIPNFFIRQYLQKAPIGLDGELVVGNSFQQSTSGIMSFEGQPDFTFWVFDSFLAPKEPFQERLYAASTFVEAAQLSRVKLLMHKAVQSEEELELAERDALAGGFEGLMVRAPFGHYKYGRSTAGERLLGKVKRFEDREACVVGAVPLFRNTNEAEKDNLGLTKRSSDAAGKVEMDTLGALVVVDAKFPKEFQIGTGFTQSQRKALWLSPPLGKIIKYKYLPHGTVDLPRHPVFLGFRHESDM
jgi:DNA ligase-1